MTDLPICRLCKCAPTDSQTVTVMVTCSKSNCPCSEAWYTEKQWRRLMYMPPRKSIAEDGDSSWLYGYQDGYNTALVDLEKGGL